MRLFSIEYLDRLNAKLVLVNARVVSKIDDKKPNMLYIPEHTLNSEQVEQQTLFSVFTTPADWDYHNPPNMFNVVATGKLADACCKYCSPSRVIHLVCNTTFPRFTIKEIAFGEEFDMHIAYEIGQGIRPMNWNDPLHPDWEVYNTMKTLIRKSEPDYNTMKFRFANISTTERG